MKKQYWAILAAVLMTACMGLGILAIGGAAFFNPNGAPVANSSTQAVQVADPGASQQVQIQQMQSLLTQYQSRDQQYQQREQQYKQQLSQAQAQLAQDQQQFQQIQLLLNALQQRGLITVSSDGRIFINR